MNESFVGASLVEAVVLLTVKPGSSSSALITEIVRPGTLVYCGSAVQETPAEMV